MSRKTGYSGLEPQLDVLVAAIRERVHLQVFVTLTCPYCPKMAHLAHRFAYANDRIRADVIEGAEFPGLVARYGVEGLIRVLEENSVAHQYVIGEGEHADEYWASMLGEYLTFYTAEWPWE